MHDERGWGWMGVDGGAWVCVDKLDFWHTFFLVFWLDNKNCVKSTNVTQDKGACSDNVFNFKTSLNRKGVYW